MAQGALPHDSMFRLAGLFRIDPFRRSQGCFPVFSPKVDVELDLEKIEEEKKYDGYYSIVTSELKMSDKEMREIYRGLTRIEDAFKITKTEFCSRPVFVRTNDHIDAHFTTCFTALVTIRLLQAKLENKYPVGKVLDSLKKYSCVPHGLNYYQFIYYDKILDECQKVFGIELNNHYRTRQQIQRLLRY